ncbi:MAG: 2Fe-2S iron-sulfur cluster binding domain-containing protein [Anaerolineales bacterium]|nr:2Fe-2S iron-sulfur cluster binding domain-containing protein [Anaerolineales bacterium]
MSLPHLHLVNFLPLDRTVVASAGSTLLEAAHRAGVNLGSICSGQGDCGECRVVVLEGQISAPTSEEGEKLTAEELRAGMRLACCTRLYGSVKVWVVDQVR